MAKFTKRDYLKSIKNLSADDLREALVREAELRFDAEQKLKKIQDVAMATMKQA